MKTLALLLSLAALVAAIELVNRASSPSTVALQLQRRHGGRPVNPHITRRDTVPETLSNEVSYDPARTVPTQV